MSRFTLSLVLLAVSLVQLSVAQTPIYFTYFTPTGTSAGTYPAVCGTGQLSCTLTTGTTSNYTCQSLTSGTHYYYPSATAPTFANAFTTGSLPSICHNYTANQVLPITAAGLNLQYGSGPTCINLYATRTGISVSPDARTGVTNLTYSTSQSGVASCPAAVAATSSGSATVGFVYTITATSGSVVCGAGNLACSSYGSNEYQCSTLNGGGVQYFYNRTSNTTSQQTLGGEVECNSFGDGSLPLNYEGISFGLGSSPIGCTSIYGYTNYSTGAVTPMISYNLISGTNTFTYQSTAINNVAQACQAYVPYITVTPNSAASSSSLLSVIALLFISVLALSL